MVLAARAFVVLAKGRVSADHQEILAGGQALMPCAGRQDGDVAGFQLQGTPAASAELHLPFAAGDAEHFMDAGIVMHIVVNAIPPGVAPAVAFEPSNTAAGSSFFGNRTAP